MLYWLSSKRLWQSDTPHTRSGSPIQAQNMDILEKSPRWRLELHCRHAREAAAADVAPQGARAAEQLSRPLDPCPSAGFVDFTCVCFCIHACGQTKFGGTTKSRFCFSTEAIALQSDGNPQAKISCSLGCCRRCSCQQPLLSRCKRAPRRRRCSAVPRPAPCTCT